MNYKLIIIAIIVILVIVFGAWYLYSGPGSQTQVGQQIQSDTTSSIANDLNQTPDDSAANSEFNALDQSLQGF